MGKHAKGRRLPVPPVRRLLTDLMHFSLKTPTVICQRQMQLAPVVAAREACQVRPSWTAIFAKAFSLVARDRPVLRRVFITFPRVCVYEHPCSSVSFTVERSIDGEDSALLGHYQEPEAKSLDDFTDYIRRCQTQPLEAFGDYRRARRLARVPTYLRRWLWWAFLNALGGPRARMFGTFGVTSTASAGGGMLQILSVLTSTLHYGLFEPDGSLDMRLTFDHRVYDGATAARTLVELERCLLSEVKEELFRMSGQLDHVSPQASRPLSA